MILLGFVHPGEVRTLFMESVLKTISSGKYELMVAGRGSGPLIARARNELVDAFLDSPATHFFSVDTDVVFEDNILDMLLRADKPIVSAHYLGITEGSTFPVGNIRKDDGTWEKASYKALKGRKGIRPVTAVGMGCTLIKREVFESLGTGPLWPFAESLDEATPSGVVDMLGEDVTFCVRAAEKGFSSFIHLDAKVGHLKTKLFL